MIGHAVDQLHDEVGPAGVRGTAIEDAGDVDMVHQRQGLPLGLEAGDDLAAVHAGLDDFEGDFALHGLGLLGHPDDAHAAFADLLQQLVRADRRARVFALSARCHHPRSFEQRLIQKTAGCLVGFEQPLDLSPQANIALTGAFEISGAFVQRFLVNGRQENLIGLH